MAVYPVFDLVFALSTDGVVEHGSVEPSALTPVSEMETFEVSIDGTVIDWSPMEQKGWVRRLMTGKSFSISLSGKRQTDDPGNDYVAGLALKTGNDCSTTAAVVFPDGDALIFDCVVDVSRHFGGASTDVSGLDFDLLSDGKPTYVASASAPAFRTYTVAPSGTPSNKLTFDFNAVVNTLPIEDIIITSGSSSAVKGALSKGTQNKWELLITAGGTGTIFVTIRRSDDYRFESAAKKVNLVGA